MSLVACCLGCQNEVQVVKDRATATGTVTLDGQPLPAGTITFVSVSGSVDTSVKIRDGVYFTDRVPIGKNSVLIDTSSIQMGNPAKYVPIPARYNDVAKSGLTAAIEPGDNENVDFKLESK